MAFEYVQVIRLLCISFFRCFAPPSAKHTPNPQNHIKTARIMII